MFRFKVEGLAHLPREGPGVVVAPHRSWLDPPCVSAALGRPVRFLIMERVYNRRWSRWFYRQMGSIPVRLGGGPVTVTALRGALRALRSGALIGIFPEGRVLPDGPLGRMHPGAAMLAIRAEAPVIPLVIDGSSRAWPHGRRWPGPAAVGVRIGEPIFPPAGKEREVVVEFMDRIRHALEELGVEPDHARRADRDR